MTAITIYSKLLHLLYKEVMQLGGDIQEILAALWWISHYFFTDVVCGEACVSARMAVFFFNDLRNMEVRSSVVAGVTYKRS